MYHINLVITAEIVSQKEKLNTGTIGIVPFNTLGECITDACTEHF